MLPDMPGMPRHTGMPGDLVDWYVLVSEDPWTVLGTKTSRLQTTLRYVCPDTEHMHPDERASYLARLHRILCTLQGGWAADWDWWHEEAAVYPASTWDNASHWLVDEIRRMEYTAEPRFESEAYLTVSWAPSKRKHRWLDGLFLANRAIQRYEHQKEAEVQAFQLGITRFVNLLQDVMEVEPLDADATATYLHRGVSWDRHPVRCPRPAVSLDCQLTNTPFVPGEPPLLGKTWIQPIWITGWQEEIGTWLPVALEKLPFPCRWHVRWEPMAARAAVKYLKQEERRWAQSYSSFTKKLKQTENIGQNAEVEGRHDNPDAQEAGRSILRTRDEVLQGQEMLGVLNPTLLTWHHEQESLVKQVNALETLAFSQQLIIDRERAGASIGWISSLPGNVAVGVRGTTLRTQELAALMPHTTVWAGPQRDAHLGGPPLLVATTDGTPFRLVTHVGELGHVMIAGPSRSGKSGLLGLLARQWFRYPNAKVCMFDRDFALKSVTALSGGVHYALGTPGSPGPQPLGQLDTEEDKRWAQVWLESILEGGGLKATPEEREEIWAMVQRLARLRPEQRTMSMARQQLQVQRLKVGLTPFCREGTYPFFDATTDEFALQGCRMVCFEMGALLGHPRALDAAMTYLFHVLEKTWFDGSPVAVLMDEARWLLANKVIGGEAEIWLKARAKKNVSLFLSTQELADIHRTSAWQAVLGNVPTWIFLPNARARDRDVAEFYGAVGLADAEMSTIMTAQPLRDYLYRSRLGTRLFQMVLSPIERKLCAASTMEELAVLAEMQQRETPESLPVAWLRHWGYDEEAQILEENGDVFGENTDDYCSTGLGSGGV